MENLSKLFDVLFNGRPAEIPKEAVTIRQLIERGISHVLVDGKLYRVEVTEAKVTK